MAQAAATRTLVKLAGSISPGASASRHSSEFAAKHNMATQVRSRVREDMRGFLSRRLRDATAVGRGGAIVPGRLDLGQDAAAHICR